MIEAGLVDHWMKRYWPTINPCSVASLSKAGEALTLSDTQSAFLLIFIGTVLASIILLGEWFAKSPAYELLQGLQIFSYLKKRRLKLFSNNQNVST